MKKIFFFIVLALLFLSNLAYAIDYRNIQSTQQSEKKSFDSVYSGFLSGTQWARKYQYNTLVTTTLQEAGMSEGKANQIASGNSFTLSPAESYQYKVALDKLTSNGFEAPDSHVSYTSSLPQLTSITIDSVNIPNYQYNPLSVDIDSNGQIVSARNIFGAPIPNDELGRISGSLNNDPVIKTEVQKRSSYSVAVRRCR